MATTVPTWALENRARFLTAPDNAGDFPSKPLISWASIFDSMYGADALKRAGVVVERAVSSGMLTKEASRIAPPPPGLTPGADYYRNVDNHPDVLSTMLETARVTAGYSVATGPGNQTNQAAAMEQHQAFLRFLYEVDKYYIFVSPEKYVSRRITNSSHDCNALLKAVADVVEEALGDAGQGLTESIQDTVRTSADYITSSSGSNSIWTVGYQNVNLPPPSAQQDSNRNPVTALCFSIVGMTRRVVNGVFKSTTSTSDDFYITTATYRLRSSIVIRCANWLAGSAIFSAEGVVAALNAKP